MLGKWFAYTLHEPIGVVGQIIREWAVEGLGWGRGWVGKERQSMEGGLLSGIASGSCRGLPALSCSCLNIKVCSGPPRLICSCTLPFPPLTPAAWNFPLLSEFR